MSAAGKHSQPYPWEQRKLGEIAEEVKGNSGSINNIPILTISAANGWMNQKDRFSQIIAGNELKKYTLLKKGELSYNHGNSKLAKYGTVFVQDSHDQALVPRVYHSFKMVAQNNPYFIEYLFASGLPNKELSKIVTSGARMDGLLNINKKEFFSIKLNNPSSEEQSRIAKLFQSLDKTITLHEEKQRQLEQLKKALLQKMFADETGYPALRFKRFSTAWEQHKLSKLTTKISTGKSKYKLQDNGRYPILGSTSVIGYDNNFDYTGDFILTARVGANAGNLYRFSGSVKITDNTVFIKSKYNKFLYYYLQKYDLKKLSFGTGQPLVKASELKNLKILKPRLDEEIYRISKLLLSVDNLITLHQHKIDNLKRLKRALLQKMFV